jgi:hypothetical protein
MDVRQDGNPTQNVEVTFNYQGNQRVVTTNANGRAETSFNKGNGGLATASASDYPSQQLQVILQTNCPAGSTNTNTTNNGGGSVLGATTSSGNSTGNGVGGTGGGSILGISTDPAVAAAGRSGQVLGATTLAPTHGFVSSLLSLAIQASVLPLGLALTLHAEKK